MRHGNTRLDKGTRTIDRYLSEFKEKNLVQHAQGRKGGYELTERGIAVFRKVMKAIVEKGQQRVDLPSRNKILSIKALEKPKEGNCCYCGKNAVLYFQGEGFMENEGLLVRIVEKLSNSNLKNDAFPLEHTLLCCFHVCARCFY